ncbi:hypothetical protein DFH08DRAFT_815387 [Mycena albidolilacea]|uniref:Uncharacterized protein n=1 Tax=Mycena albidolilacea TaxID=1033008 RepID=A0AAD6ZMR0_9AGAR|nr:hypothetical protein DFH08DRAFT_815387 [Mycena albidolilacea]
MRSLAVVSWYFLWHDQISSGSLGSPQSNSPTNSVHSIGTTPKRVQSPGAWDPRRWGGRRAVQHAVGRWGGWRAVRRAVGRWGGWRAVQCAVGRQGGWGPMWLVVGRRGGREITQWIIQSSFVIGGQGRQEGSIALPKTRLVTVTMPPVAFVKTMTWPGNFRNIFFLPKNGQNGAKKSQIGPSAPLVSPKVSIWIEIKAISVHQFSTVTAKSGLVALPNFFDGVTYIQSLITPMYQLAEGLHLIIVSRQQNRWLGPRCLPLQKCISHLSPGLKF